MAKCPKCGADMVNDGDNLKCPNCNSTQIKESANAGQAKNGDAQQSELDLLKARLAELEKKQEKNDKVKTGSLSVKEKLATVAVFFKKWGLKAVLPAALFLIAFITLLVCFCGLRGIYVNVDNPNEFYSFSPTSYEYHGTTLTGDEYVDEGTWKTGGGMLSLTYEDEMFGKITESCPFSHMSYDTIFITDALGDKKEFRRVSVLAYSTPQKTEYTLNLNGGSGSGAGENKLSVGSKIKEPSEPTRRGYQFMGWYTTPDGWKTEGASQFNFNSRIWEDTTVYANWKDLITEYRLTGDMLPEEGVTFLEGDDLTQIYQSAGGVKEKIGNGSAVIEFKDENGKIVSGTAPRSNVTAKLKEVVIGNNVSSIPGNAFNRCTSLSKVTIPDSVTSIGDRAFYYCNSLKSVNIPYSVLYIGDKAFFNSQNKTTVYIAFPSTPSNWSPYWFITGINVIYGKTMTSGSDGNYNYYILDDGIYLTEYIGSNTVVEIPEYIDGKKVVGLGSIFESNTTVTSVTIPDGVANIPYRMFYECTSLTSVTIPDSVTSIGDYAFYNCTSLTSVTIPDSVTSIGDEAFSRCDSLTSVTIGNGVTSIGDEAFFDCSSLTSVTIGNGVTSIGDSAFEDCTSLTSVNIPDSVTSMGDGAFSYCDSLSSVTIGNSVTSIGYGAFYGCTSLTSVTIGNGVTSIGDSAFYNCTSLTSVTIGDGVTSIGDYAFRNCDSLTSITIPDSVTSIGDDAFYLCTSLSSVTIPDSVTSIGDEAFSRCDSLTSVTIPDSVTIIGEKAFENCTSLDDVYYTSDIASWLNIGFESRTANPLYNGANLYLNGELATDIVIPGSVTSIGDYAFYGCTSLTSVTIPDSVTSIGYYAFRGCTYLTIYCEAASKPSGWDNNWNYSDCPVVWDANNSDVADDGYIYYIGENGLRYTLKNTTATVVRQARNLSGNIEIPASVSYKGITYSVTSIGDRAFSGCTSLTSVTIPDGVTSIGDYAFYNCTSLKSVTIPDSVTSIGRSMFYDCTSLKSVTIPDSVTSIGSSAFRGCTSLKSVTIPDSVTSIGDNAFNGCTSLTSVTIGNSVTSIGSYAFYGCTSLTIYCEAASKPGGWDNDWNDSGCPVVWDANNSDVADDGYIYYIDENGLRYALNGTTARVVRQAKNLSGNIEIPASVSYKGITYSVTSIGYRAFYDCDSLTSVTIPDSVTSIGRSMFYDCTSLKSVTIPDSVTSIGEDAFYNCTSFTSVTIGDGVTSIGYQAFYGCTSLTSITIPDGVTSIGSYAFAGCTVEINWGNNPTIETISSKAFSGYRGTSITIPDSVTTIGSSAFSSCTSLTSVTIPDSVTSIGDYAFDNTPYYNNLPNGEVYLGRVLYKYKGNMPSNYSVIIKEGTVSISNSAFSGCTSLTSVTIPASVTSIGYQAFSGCTSLKSVTIPDSVTSIGYQAFYDCTSLTSVTIGDGVTSIGYRAFYYCTSLTSVTIGDSVTSIGDEAFSYCRSLTSVTFEGTTEQWWAISKGWNWNNKTPFTVVYCSNAMTSA